MNPRRALAIVQAGGAGGRMDVLTLERAKPALPYAGTYQLLDFPLSNLVNAGLDEVWLSVQYQASVLHDQVRNGRPWDLDRTRGGLRLLVPQQGSGSLDEDGFAQGNADELYRLRDDVRRSGAEVVIVLSADHVYRLDLRDVLDDHVERGAELTMVTTDVSGVRGEDAGDHGVVEVDDDGRVTGFAYKPEKPAGTVVSTEIFVYDAAVLVEVLEELHRELSAESEEGDSGLGDFGDVLVPRFVERGRVRAWRHDGYWRDLGQPQHYLNAHLELLDGEVDVFDPHWPIRTKQPEREAAYVDSTSVEQSMISPGARVHGTVRRSVIGPGVRIEAGAEVVESVLLADCVVRSGARVARAVVDSDCRLGEGARVGSVEADLEDPEAVTLVGRDSTVDGVVPAGSRLPPGTTA